MWIDLPEQTMAKLGRVARFERREPREQAAYFIERALARAETEHPRPTTAKVPTPA
jgi:hypothetical protein